jgi:ribosomal protein S18 acetylase RimI-like enzyme
MTANPAPDKIRVRALRDADLDRLVAIDRHHVGRSRRRLLERRLAMHAAAPAESLQFGAEVDGRLAGFVLARVQRGEFGRTDSSAVIDVLGVDPANRGQGCGRALMDAITAEARARGLPRLHSQADWTMDELLRFFAGAGFELSSRLVIERPVALPFDESPDEI